MYICCVNDRYINTWFHLIFCHENLEFTNFTNSWKHNCLIHQLLCSTVSLFVYDSAQIILEYPKSRHAKLFGAKKLWSFLGIDFFCNILFFCWMSMFFPGRLLELFRLLRWLLSCGLRSLQKFVNFHSIRRH